MRKIFMGHTSYQQVVSDVAEFSIKRHSKDVEIYPIDQQALRDLRLYTRERNPNEATEFSFTRFLTPYLAGYKGWVLFMDNDMLCKDDINKLFDMADDSKAVMVVKHNYTAKEGIKLDGQRQTVYPRKNWSSVILWNASHPANRCLTPEFISNVSGLYLHRLMWLDDELIGELPSKWNYLVDEYQSAEKGHNASMLHYTLGGPYFTAYRNCSFAEDWKQEYERMTGKPFTHEDEIKC